MNRFVPSDDAPDGLTALRSVMADGATVRAAVAFVTHGGVDHLEELLSGLENVSIEIAARAGGVTDPDALVRLTDELGALVSVAIGQDANLFHPKLWLVEHADRLDVVSGSGNLTRTGLAGNVEQFEVRSLDTDSEQAEAERARFERVTASCHALDVVLRTTLWGEFVAIYRKQKIARAELRRVEKKLTERQMQGDRNADKRVLLTDLDDLYTATVAARLPTPSGRAYVPSRFRQATDRVHRGADAVRLVTTICRQRTRGFDVLVANARPDLAVEQLVLDSGKPYHDLFGVTTRRLSEERLGAFTEPSAAAPSGPLTNPHPTASAEVRGRLLTRPLSQSDFGNGVVRLRGAALAALPDEPTYLSVTVRGLPLSSCRWNPNAGSTDSGVLRLGKPVVADLEPRSELTVSIGPDGVTLT